MISTVVFLASALQPDPTFAAQADVRQVNRIALTPQLDGVIAEEEWERLNAGGDHPSFFQWEPDTLYFAAKAKVGEAIVVSLDYNGDGWLIGDDNIEFRMEMVNGTLTSQMRRLDGTDPQGPRWTDKEIMGQSFRAAVSQEGDVWAIESAWTPFFDQSPEAGRIVGIRIDPRPVGEVEAAAFLPRTMSFVGLRWDNSENLFVGLAWQPGFRVRSVARDDGLKVRYEFTQSADCPVLKSVSFRGEGLAREDISTLTNPFPSFNSRGRAGMDYASQIGQSATSGYRVLRATVVASDGSESILRSSFRISDLVDFDVRLPKVLEAKVEAQIVRGSVVLDSQGFGRVEGTFSVIAPPEWTVTKGKDEKFLIYHSRGVARMPVELVVPNGTRGVFPLTFRATVGERVMTKTIFMPVR